MLTDFLSYFFSPANFEFTPLAMNLIFSLVLNMAVTWIIVHFFGSTVISVN